VSSLPLTLKVKPPPPPPAAKVYTCAHSNHTCNVVPPGTPGASGLSACNKTCQPPPKMYQCKAGTFSCDEVTKPGTGVPLSVCKTSCVKPKPGKPGTPAILLGVWRGLGLNANYSYGEWDIKFTNDTATIRTPLADAPWEAKVIYHSCSCSCSGRRRQQAPYCCSYHSCSCSCSGRCRQQAPYCCSYH